MATACSCSGCGIISIGHRRQAGMSWDWRVRAGCGVVLCTAHTDSTCHRSEGFRERSYYAMDPIKLLLYDRHGTPLHIDRCAQRYFTERDQRVRPCESSIGRAFSVCIMDTRLQTDLSILTTFMFPSLYSIINAAKDNLFRLLIS